MRKLAGTRAGKPLYVAFDLELVMQHGCRVFRTDEAILSPDCGFQMNASLQSTTPANVISIISIGLTHCTESITMNRSI